MATAAADDLFPLRRSHSMEWLPPGMSELRVLLLGNSWSERSSVGNLVLGKIVFNTEREPDRSLVNRGQIKEKNIVLINTPDLLSPNISDEKLTEHVTDCVKLSDPGPHVFLLVLQPKGFIEIHKFRLSRVLKRFSDKSLDRSLILISPREQESKYPQHPALKDMIRECRYRYLELENLELPELLTRLGQIVKEHNGEHVSCDVFMDPTGDLQNTQQEKTKLNLVHHVISADIVASVDRVTPPPPGEIRILLLGKNYKKITKLGDFITEKEEHQSHGLKNPFQPKQMLETGDWRGKPLKVIKTDVFSQSVEKLRGEMRNAVGLCSPGPNVLLLLVKPSEFTEENRQTLKIILSLFGQDAFKHSVVISTQEDGQKNNSFKRLLRDCGDRHYNMSANNHESLLTQIESLFNENKGAFLTLAEELIPLKPEKMKPALNLVLCGRRGAGKTSAAEAILDLTGLHSASSSSECVKHQGEVCGHWVSLVELPALSGKPLETVMEESFRCVSLCDPEGVHAFILVLPVDPLTDEDKEELKIIQDTFRSQVNDFTMILFSAESDPTAPAVVDFVKKNNAIQELVQGCGGRFFVLNIKDQQQIPKLMGSLEKMKMRPHGHNLCSYTTKTFARVQMRKISTLQEKLKGLETKGLDSCDDEKQSSERLKIVLIGKTGSGKSSSGNTILGRKVFKAESGQTSVTKECQKAHGEVDGHSVAVVDTPGLFDTSLSHEEVHEEMIKCISLLAPGPHVFLLVLHIGRLTEEEKKTLKLIREGFGKDAEKFTVILLTGGDTLEYEQWSVKEYIEKKCDDSFKKLISECGGRYHVFNNRDDKNRAQVSELMEKIDTMVKTNGGNCFTNEILQEAETAIKKEMERLLKEKEEQMQKEREELQRKHEEEMKEIEQRMKKQEEVIKREREKREKELKEKEEILQKEQDDRRKEREMREEEDRKRKVAEETQQLEWEQKCDRMEKKIKLESEEKERIHRQLEETRVKMREERERLEEMQKEWWEKRNQEEKQRRKEEQTRLRKLQEELEQERENYERKRKEEEHEKTQHREQIEKERKEKEEKLREMEQNIQKEREVRLKEQKRREEENRKRKGEEKLQKLEWEQNLSDLEKKIKSESKKKESIYRRLKETKEKMRGERESWEKEQKESREKRNQEEEQRRKEEQTRLRKLQEELEQERENYEKKIKEYLTRQEEDDEEKKAIEENHEKEKENLKKSFEEEARKKAEEFNEFKEKHRQESAAHEKQIEEKDKQYDLLKALKDQNEKELKKRHRAMLSNAVKRITKNSQNMEKIKKLLKNHEKEMENVGTEEKKEKLKESHEEEIIHLAEKLTDDVDPASCLIL